MGFECAGKTGWHDSTRTCPSCGGKLRTNSALSAGATMGVAFLVMTGFLFFMGTTFIRYDSQEHANADLAVSDPGLLVEGQTVKLEGTISGTYDTPVSCVKHGTGKGSYYRWVVHDFDLICGNRTVRIQASVLDGKGETVEILGSDGLRGAYRDGSTIAVIGIVESGTVKPQYLAPNAGAFYNGHYSMGWLMVGLGFLPILVFAFSFRALIGRYRSHWRRLSDFGAGPSVKPLGSVADVHAEQANTTGSRNKKDATNDAQAGLTVAELTKRLGKDR